MSKYGEPWRRGVDTCEGDGGVGAVVEIPGEETIAFVTSWKDRQHASRRETAYAERIVACVNACRDMDDDLVREIDPPKLTAFVKAVGTLNPAGIPFLISEVERVVAAMRANLGTYHDPTNILPTLETALSGVKP